MCVSTLQPLERIQALEQGPVWVAPVVTGADGQQVLVWNPALSLRAVLHASLAADARVLVLPAAEGHTDRQRWMRAAAQVVDCVPWCGVKER